MLEENSGKYVEAIAAFQKYQELLITLPTDLQTEIQQELGMATTVEPVTTVATPSDIDLTATTPQPVIPTDANEIAEDNNSDDGEDDDLDEGNSSIDNNPEPDNNDDGGAKAEAETETEPEPTETETEPQWELVKVSDRVAYFLNPEGAIHTTYAGFNNKRTAESWGRYLAAQNNIADGFEVRNAQRIEGFKYEIKVWQMKGLQQIEKLAASDLSKPPQKTEEAGNNDGYDIGEFVGIVDFDGIFYFHNAEQATKIANRLWTVTEFDTTDDGDLLLPTPTLADGHDWERQIQELLNPDAGDENYTEEQSLTLEILERSLTEEEIEAYEILDQPVPQAA